MDYRRVVAGALFLCTFHAGAVESLFIENVTTVDPVAGRLPAQDVLIEDGLIVATGELTVPTGDVAVIDGESRYLIPGLWDMHVHLTYEPRLSGVMGDLFLDYGITSVRDTGGIIDTLLPVVEAMRERGASGVLLGTATRRHADGLRRCRWTQDRCRLSHT